MTFVRNHAQGILACDFFVTVTSSFRLLCIFEVMEVGTLRIALSFAKIPADIEEQVGFCLTSIPV